MSAYVLVTGPDQEPLTLEEAKAQARVTHDDENDLLTEYITSAREACEEYMGRGLYTQTWKLVLDEWADVMPLPMAAPLQSVTTVQYYAADGTLTALASSVYDTHTTRRPAAVTLKPSQVWPPLQSGRLAGRIVITYVVGWASLDLIPQRIKRGIALYVTYQQADRDGMDRAFAESARIAACNCWSDRVIVPSASERVCA
jgi:uncharacterized phiE125 gp8 family phage protein